MPLPLLALLAAAPALSAGTGAAAAAVPTAIGAGIGAGTLGGGIGGAIGGGTAAAGAGTLLAPASLAAGAPAGALAPSGALAGGLGGGGGGGSSALAAEASMLPSEIAAARAMPIEQVLGGLGSNAEFGIGEGTAIAQTSPANPLAESFGGVQMGQLGQGTGAVNVQGSPGLFGGEGLGSTAGQIGVPGKGLQLEAGDIGDALDAINTVQSLTAPPEEEQVPPPVMMKPRKQPMAPISNTQQIAPTNPYAEAINRLRLQQAMGGQSAGVVGI